jgi:hypothetical protein
MRREVIREQVKAAEKRLDHCRRFIGRQSQVVEDLHNAGHEDAEKLAHKVLITAIQVRRAREEEVERLLRDLSVAS